MRLVVAVLTLMFALTVHAKDSPDSLGFGVVPQQSAAKLAKLWGPLIRTIEQRSGVKMHFHTAPDIPTFEKRVVAGEYDLAYMNPYHYTVFSKVPGYRAFAKERGKRIKGIVVVAKDSPITDIAQLNGQEMAFPAPAAFAATVLPRASFEKMGLNITPKFVGSHDSVYLTVAKGLYPAGGGVVRTFNNINAQLRNRLRILWETEKYTPHAFAAHPRVNDEKVARVLKAIESLSGDEEGKKLLKALSFRPLESATDADWDDVRELNIKLLDKVVVE